MVSANKKREMMDQEYNRHFLISGRRCGCCEDAVAFISAAEDQDPEQIFIRDILYRGALPVGWEDRSPTYDENNFGEWAYINGNIELPFPVSGTEHKLQALVLDDFRLESGKISSDATLPSP